MAEKSRKGDNLYTCSIVALNPDTGKLVWYFQPSPHDVHDWDAVETPVLFDGVIDGQAAQARGAGQPQRLLLRAGPRHRQAASSATPFIDTLNWAKGFDAKGQPIPDPAKYPTTDGVLVSPSSGGATNWQAPSFNPETGPVLRRHQPVLQHVLSDRHRRPSGRVGRPGYQCRDRTATRCSPSTTGPGRRSGGTNGPAAAASPIICPRRASCCSPATASNLIAFDAANGKILWHTHVDGGSQRRADHVYAGRQAVPAGRGRETVCTRSGSTIR